MSKAKTEATELQEAANLPEMVRAFGRSYEIRKFTFGPMTQALEYIGPMGYLLRKLAEFPRDKKGNVKATPEQMMEFAVTAVSISGPSVFGLVSVATKEPIEWLENQDAMDGLKLFAKVVEKNLDFFSRQNIDQVTAMLGGFQERIPELGGPPSTT
jgi:hypothetical protein